MRPIDMRRRLALALGFLLALAPLATGMPAAGAQEPPVRLALLEQTPWNRPEQPQVTVRFRAENTSNEQIDDLAIGLTLWPPVFSRTEFEASLESDPADAAALLAETRARVGSLGPGETRDFEVRFDLPVAQLSAQQSLIYPLKIDLRSGYQSLAAIRTPVIYLVRQPLVPLALTASVILHAPLVVRPDGTFGSPALQTSISRGGRLAATVSALARLVASGTSVDVVVSPTLLLQLQQMRDGYALLDGGSVRSVRAGEGASAAAGAMLQELRAIASSPNVELSALPYAEPLLPALTSGGLVRDLGVQLQRGRELVAGVLGADPSVGVLRPPRSALDGASLDELPALGVSTLLLDPATVPVATDAQGFAPPPVVHLAAQNATLSAVVADPSVQAMLDSDLVRADPVLGAQAILGELASIWLQQPGEPRAIAIVLGDDAVPPPAFFGPLLREIAGAPWLAPRTASELVRDADLLRGDVVGEIVPADTSFSRPYIQGIKRARRDVQVLRSMLVQPSGQPGHLDQLLLLAESQRFVGDERQGLAFVQRVTDTVRRVFGAVRPQVAQPITLTSSSIRDVPIAVRNTAKVPLRVTLRLQDPHLRSPIQRTRVFPPESTQTVNIDLALKTTGRFQIRLQVVAPSGRVLAETPLTIRSTAYNRIALLITFGAALLAMLVWARRFLPRRTA